MQIETAVGAACADLCDSLVEAGVSAHVETLKGGAALITVDGDDHELLRRLGPVMERWFDRCAIASAAIRFEGRSFGLRR